MNGMGSSDDPFVSGHRNIPKTPIGIKIYKDPWKLVMDTITELYPIQEITKLYASTAQPKNVVSRRIELLSLDSKSRMLPLHQET